MANVFQKVQLRFGDGSVREREGRGGRESKQQGRLKESEELVLGWKFQTGREREGQGRGGFPASLSEKRLEKGSRTPGLEAAW